MEIEKIFKNLILFDFGILILIVISSIYQPQEIIEINSNIGNFNICAMEICSSIKS